MKLIQYMVVCSDVSVHWLSHVYLYTGLCMQICMCVYTFDRSIKSLSEINIFWKKKEALYTSRWYMMTCHANGLHWLVNSLEWVTHDIVRFKKPDIMLSIPIAYEQNSKYLNMTWMVVLNFP